jgi:hypothetical protein
MMILFPARKGLFIFVIAATISGGVCLPHARAEYAEYAVVIVLDGCRSDYLRRWSLPRIEELAERGITYDTAWVGQLPTNTPPGHATLGTGVFPAHHHVAGFKWKDPETGRSFYPCTIKNIRAGELVRVIADAGAPSVFGLYKEAHPEGFTLAMSSVKPYAALGMGTLSADYILFTPSSKKGKAWGEEGIEKGQVRRFESLPGHGVEKEILDLINRRIKPYEHAGDFDTWVVDAFLVVFEKKRPRFSMINLPETDEMGHACGGISSPETMRAVVKNVDVQIGRIIDAFKAAGIFEKTLFVVTADHGMVPNAYNVAVSSYIEAYLRPQDLLRLGLTTPYSWLRNSTRSKAVAERIANMSAVGIDAVFYKNSYGNQPSYHKASQSREDMYDQAWNYLLSTLACGNSPDVFLSLRENTVIGRKFPPNQRGKHYQGTWGTQHIPLIVSGPGVRPGVSSDWPARLVDIPPTILTLMGIVPRGMDGIVLADALKDRLPEQIAAQKEIRPTLQQYQRALMGQSRHDLKEVEALPETPFWNPLWSYDLLMLVFFGVMLFMIRLVRLPTKLKRVSLAAGFLLLIASQVLFVLILRRLLEI